jgi:hypothetical protein
MSLELPAEHSPQTCRTAQGQPLTHQGLAELLKRTQYAGGVWMPPARRLAHAEALADGYLLLESLRHAE